MKDIVIEKKKEKAIANRNGSTNLPKMDYQTNQLVNALHPKWIAVELTQIIEENEKTKSFYFKNKLGSMPNFEAGSYIVLEVEIDGKKYKRPFSISSSPKNKNEYRITIQKCENGIVSNYMFYNAKLNQEFILEGPFGNFHYNAIRDSKDVIFIAGGSGITPIMSMILDLTAKKKINSMTLCYGVKTEKDLIFQKELEELKKVNESLKIIYVLSEEEKEEYKNGYINEELIKSLNPEGKSFFVCGPTEMYESLNEIFKSLAIPNRFIRHEIYSNRLTDTFRIEHILKVKTNDEIIEIPCYENETILESMENAKEKVPSRCRVGVCGYCRSKLLSGTVKTEIAGLRKKDIETKCIHPCVTYPTSDITIELPF